jgi:flagellar biosynthesis protein FlhB
MAQDTEQDDRTEEPTARKLEKAIERGDVPKSLEVNTWFLLGGMIVVLMMVAAPASRQLTVDLRAFLMNAHQIPSDASGLMAAGQRALSDTLKVLALPLLILVMAGILGGAIQNRPLWTLEPLKPQLSRISPLAGFKRIFGVEALIQFLKGLIKIGLVGGLCLWLLWTELDRLENLAKLDNTALLPVILALSLKLIGGVMAFYTLVALADLIYQRVSWLKRQRMTPREIKEEFKETDGNPEIKAKLRQMRAQRAKKRMMAAVPQASVIIANPTHYAVALKYEEGMVAPVCLAKGTDLIALRIRSIAEENAVPVVENPPLARTLHASVEIDEEIPVEHYKAVAEVIGFVLRLRRRAG